MVVMAVVVQMLMVVLLLLVLLVLVLVLPIIAYEDEEWKTRSDQTNKHTRVLGTE